MMLVPAENPRPWVIITDYPRWPSPYFAHLHRYAPVDLRLSFRPDLASIAATERPGVLNLHRLKRLYHDPALATRTPQAAAALLDTLTGLRDKGWRLVWTVHNLLPIDGQTSGTTDDAVTHGVLDLVDVVLCHTHADAASMRARTNAEVRVIGWAGLDRPAQPPTRAVAELVARMRAAPLSFLLLGHITRYKDAPATVVAFLASTAHAHLTVAGAGHDPLIAGALASVIATSGGRVTRYEERVPPEHVGHLYAAAHAAVCPYRTDQGYDFFTEVLHASSVTTATGFHVPVIAPELSAIDEITHDRTRWLAPAGTGLGSALARAEAELRLMSRDSDDPRTRRRPADSPRRWTDIGHVYRSVATELIAS